MTTSLAPYLTDTAVVVVGVVIAELALDLIRRARKRAHMRALNRKSVAARQRRANALTPSGGAQVPGSGDVGR